MSSADPLVLRYRQKIRLCAVSAYASAPAAEPMGIGYYEKNGRHGILSCVPPLGPKLDHLFNEDEYLVLDPTNQREVGSVVEYGHALVLVNQHGMVWNNKTGGITGYIGPRPRNIAGEMYVTFRKRGMSLSGPSTKDRSATIAGGAAPSSAAATSAPAPAVTSQDRVGSSPALLSLPAPQGPVRFGDANVVIAVVESNRHSSMFNKCFSNFKKPTSRIEGGYICCDGKGTELKFTICPSKPKIEQISMMNKLITSYHYGQKIALPLALLDKDKAKRTGNTQPAEILFKLSNQATATLPGALLQKKLLAHAATDGNTDKESNFVLPLRNGPGELVVKLIGTAPRRALGRLANDKALGGKKPRVSLFYLLVSLLLAIPMPVFALLYAIMTHFSWTALSGMEHGVKREAIVLLLVLFPAFYLAVKVDHPFSALFNPPQLNRDLDDEPQASGSLKLIITEYRFAAGAAAPVSSLSRPAAKSSAAADGGKAPVTAPAGSSVDAGAVPRRFILAEKGDEEKGRARYEETLQWRQAEGINEILTQPSPNFQMIKQNYPHYYHKRGKNNEPVYYEKPGKINLKALRAAGITLDDLMRNYLMVTEFLWQVIEKDDNAKCISVVDVEGIGISDFAGEAVEYVRKAGAVSGKHYPERCAHIFIINVPSWFSMIWNTVKGMIDEVTREKVHIVKGKKNIFEALATYIPEENIPEEYGGSSEGTSPEEDKLFQLMAYLNKAPDAPATNPIA